MEPYLESQPRSWDYFQRLDQEPNPQSRHHGPCNAAHFPWCICPGKAIEGLSREEGAEVDGGLQIFQECVAIHHHPAISNTVSFLCASLNLLLEELKNVVATTLWPVRACWNTTTGVYLTIYMYMDTIMHVLLIRFLYTQGAVRRRGVKEVVASLPLSTARCFLLNKE